MLFFVLFLSIGVLIFTFSYKSSLKTIYFSPSIHAYPSYTPTAGYPLFENYVSKKNYKTKWIDLKTIRKRSAYVKQLRYFFLNQNRAKALVFHNFFPSHSKRRIKNFNSKKKILVMWEPPSVLIKMYHPRIFELFDQIYTWNDNLVDGKKFFKMYYPVLKPIQNNLPSFEKRKLLCMIASNLKFNDFPKQLYPIRKNMAQFFEKLPHVCFDLYGRNWENFSNAKGRIPDKLTTLKNYKFNICFENTAEKGYITEKIFDCFATQTVPIYLGATNIETYIPKGCYIDYRQFKGPDEMLNYIQKFSKKDYETYTANIKAFLQTKQAHRFSRAFFSSMMIKAIENESSYKEKSLQ